MIVTNNMRLKQKDGLGRGEKEYLARFGPHRLGHRETRASDLWITMVGRMKVKFVIGDPCIAD